MNATTRKIYRRPVVTAKTGYSVSSLDRLEAKGLFPARVKLNPFGRAVGWYSDEVDQWLNDRQSVKVERVDCRDVTKIGKGCPGPGRPKKAAQQPAAA